MSAVRRVTFARTPAVGSSGLKDAEGGRQQQQSTTPTPIVFSESPESPGPSPSPGMVSSPELGEVSSDYGPLQSHPAVVEVGGDVTAQVTSQTASQPEPESTSGYATAEVAAVDGGGGMSDVQARKSAVVQQDTPAAAVVTTTAAVEPAQDNDSLEVQVGQLCADITNGDITAAVGTRGMHGGTMGMHL